MKQFFKFTFASMLGFVLAGGVLILLIFGLIAGAISSAKDFNSADNIKVAENSILHLNLNQIIDERGNDQDLVLPASFGLFAENSIGINQIKRALKEAAVDGNIKGIYLDVGVASAGYASIKEIRDAIIDFKKSGKWVYAYSNVYTQGAYYLASSADEVFVNPQGLVEWKGLYSENLFFKEALDRLGIEAQVIRGSNNKFKSAVEPFIATEMSAANKEQVAKYLGVLWDEMKREVGLSRPALNNQLHSIAEEYKVRSADDALKYQMVDAIYYKDEFKQFLAEKMDAEVEDLEFIKVKKYARKAKNTIVKAENDETPTYKLSEIAVIYANGAIGDGEGDMVSIGTNIAKALEEARNDDDVKAIVLRVNSPGGSALMSDIIWRESVLAKKEKPLVVSMGTYAASGGYYISAAADKIYAQPNTITGSIGVFGILPNGKKFMNETAGIYADGVKTNRYADMGLPTDGLNDDEYLILQQGVDNIYSSFLNVVATGRGLKTEYVDSIGQGRVWAGTDALNLGLVDALGGLDEAIADAAERAELSSYKIKELPKMKDPIEELFSEFGMKSMRMQAIKKLAGPELSKTIEQAHVLQNSQLHSYQMRMPYSINIK